VGNTTNLGEGLRLVKVDAGVYEITVPTAMLEGFRTTQLSQASWPSGRR
jgi:hypothetical protein